MISAPDPDGASMSSVTIVEEPTLAVRATLIIPIALQFDFAQTMEEAMALGTVAPDYQVEIYRLHLEPKW